MCQPCCVKTIIMYKYVGVYILVLIYNSSSMFYLGNIAEIIITIIIKDIHSFFKKILQWNGCKFSTHVLI